MSFQIQNVICTVTRLLQGVTFLNNRSIVATYRINTVNPRYNDSICSQRCCHYNEFAALKIP